MSSRFPQRSGAVAVLLFLLAPSCNKTKSFQLPPSPDAELAFGVLFDRANRPASIGPVVTSPTLYSGSYVLQSKDDSLSARLFFVKLAALEDASNQTCATLMTPEDRFACRDRVRSCDTNPVSCLAVLAAGESCGDRIDLPRTLDMRAFQASDKGDLGALEDPSGSLRELMLCGPTVKSSCPNLLPGFAITEQGAFRCAAPARQSGCDLSVDLSDCGFGGAKGTIAGGAYRASLAAAGCTIGALSADEAMLGGGGFAIVCGARRFAATHMPALFGEVGCAHRGPRLFNEARADQVQAYGQGREVHGSIRGLLAIHPSRWDGRYLILGTGFDECGFDGCIHLGGFEACGSACTNDCDIRFLSQCADETDWGPCSFGASSPDAGATPDSGIARDDCLRRCKDSCRASNFADCFDRSAGHLLTVATADRPEREIAAVSLDGVSSTQHPASGRRGLVMLGDASAPVAAIAGARAIRIFQTADKDVLVEAVGARTELDFDLAGIVPLTGRSDQLVAFGKSNEASPKGRVVVLRLLRPLEAPLQQLASITIPELGTVEELAVGGPNNGWVFAAALSAPLGGSSPNRIEIRTIDRSPSRAAVVLAGRPTVLLGLPGGAVAAGVDLGTGAPGTIDLLVPEGAAVSAPIHLPLLGRLRLSAMLQDPKTCASVDAPCRVFIGYERDGDVVGSGNALVGLLQYDRSNPSRSKLLPTFLKTTSAQVDLLAYDADLDQLIAVSSSHNQLTQIRLVR